VNWRYKFLDFNLKWWPEIAISTLLIFALNSPLSLRINGIVVYAVCKVIFFIKDEKRKTSLSPKMRATETQLLSSLSLRLLEKSRSQIIFTYYAKIGFVVLITFCTVLTYAPIFYSLQSINHLLSSIGSEVLVPIGSMTKNRTLGGPRIELLQSIFTICYAYAFGFIALLYLVPTNKNGILFARKKHSVKSLSFSIALLACGGFLSWGFLFTNTSNADVAMRCSRKGSMIYLSCFGDSDILSISVSILYATSAAFGVFLLIEGVRNLFILRKK
jgi:hypothetical protein